jgi:hypothetical protein
MNPVPFLPSPRKAGQAIGLVGLGLGLGIGGHMLLKAIDKPDSNLVEKGCGLIGFGLGLGMGGTFPDGTEWVTWLLCAFWCIVGAVMLQRRSA